MTPSFEARYINISWEDKNSAFSITESDSVIPINSITDSEFQIEAVTFSKISESEFGQIAFSSNEGDKNIIPSFEISPTEKVALMPVTNNLSGKVWWVERGKWAKKDNRRHSQIFRTPGEIVLNFGYSKCIIHVSSSSFTYKELNLYLQDFKMPTTYSKNPSSHLLSMNCRKFIGFLLRGMFCLFYLTVSSRMYLKRSSVTR